MQPCPAAEDSSVGLVQDPRFYPGLLSVPPPPPFSTQTRRLRACADRENVDSRKLDRPSASECAPPAGGGGTAPHEICTTKWAGQKDVKTPSVGPTKIIQLN